MGISGIACSDGAFCTIAISHGSGATGSATTVRRPSISKGIAFVGAGSTSNTMARLDLFGDSASARKDSVWPASRRLGDRSTLKDVDPPATPQCALASAKVRFGFTTSDLHRLTTVRRSLFSVRMMARTAVAKPAFAYSITTANWSHQQSARALVVLVTQDPRMQTGRPTPVE
jgi:hypothetical protein